MLIHVGFPSPPARVLFCSVCRPCHTLFPPFAQVYACHAHAILLSGCFSCLLLTVAIFCPRLTPSVIKPFSCLLSCSFSGCRLLLSVISQLVTYIFSVSVFLVMFSFCLHISRFFSHTCLFAWFAFSFLVSVIACLTAMLLSRHIVFQVIILNTHVVCWLSSPSPLPGCPSQGHKGLPLSLPAIA